MPATELLIRSLAADELNTAVALRAAMNQELNRADPDITYPGWRARFNDFFGRRLAAGSAAIFVAEHGSTTCGLASVYLPRTHRTEIFQQPLAYVTGVYVIPEQRRQGIATRLTQACIDWARRQGCNVVRLRASEMGRPVYLQMGFSPSE